ncbi:DinB family protein [Paenibacillus alkalitolerans]|uniref:DinB family protein n=1 Tax=Paenibacillus alkalitolerans TaxID=2799335 RepID=UPI0018F37134|nr:DinB family protein [Paenibacillus alkalitolerans]
MKLIDLFPYRNDVRKILLPYLRELPQDAWFRTHRDHPNSVAWIIRHIVEGEDGWIHETALGRRAAMKDVPLDSPVALTEAYIEIRRQTDGLLESMTVEDGDRLIAVPAFSDGWKPPSPPTWRWVFHHVYAHEAYHAGQIGVIARLNGFKGPHF